jgi:hypothetical protein
MGMIMMDDSSLVQQEITRISCMIIGYIASFKSLSSVPRSSTINCQFAFIDTFVGASERRCIKKSTMGRKRKASNTVTPSISARPHVRSKKMDAWKKAAPLTGYLQWRAMQLFMNQQMKSILQHVADISILPSSTAEELEALNCDKTIDAYASHDVRHDADVKFFGGHCTPPYEIHPDSDFFDSNATLPQQEESVLNDLEMFPSLVATKAPAPGHEVQAETVASRFPPSPQGVTPSHRAAVAAGMPSASSPSSGASPFDVCERLLEKDGVGNLTHVELSTSSTALPSTARSVRTVKGVPKKRYRDEKMDRPCIILVGSDLHISVAIVSEHGKHVEFFDSKGGNVSLDDIKSFFKSMGPPGTTFCMANKVNWQEDGNSAVEEGLDIYCNTWIYYWCYLRLVCQKSISSVVENIGNMNSRERLVEIQRFQTWLYDLPPFSTVGSDAVHAASVGHPFEQGCVDKEVLALRKLVEHKCARKVKSLPGQNWGLGVSEKFIVSGRRRTNAGGSNALRVRHIICKTGRGKEERSWFVRGARVDPCAPRAAINYLEVPPAEVPYCLFRLAKKDLLKYVEKSKLVPVMRAAVVDEYRVWKSLPLVSAIPGKKGTAATGGWVAFKMKNRMHNGAFDVVVDGLQHTRKASKRSRNIEEKMLFFLSRGSYGTEWCLLKDPMSPPPATLFPVNADAELESLEQERQRSFRVPNLFTGRLEEDVAHTLSCSSDDNACERFVHCRGLNPPANIVPEIDWLCSKCLTINGKEVDPKVEEYEYGLQDLAPSSPQLGAAEIGELLVQQTNDEGAPPAGCQTPVTGRRQLQIEQMKEDHKRTRESLSQATPENKRRAKVQSTLLV